MKIQCGYVARIDGGSSLSPLLQSENFRSYQLYGRILTDRGHFGNNARTISSEKLAEANSTGGTRCCFCTMLQSPMLIVEGLQTAGMRVVKARTVDVSDILSAGLHTVAIRFESDIKIVKVLSTLKLTTNEEGELVSLTTQIENKIDVARVMSINISGITVSILALVGKP